MLDCRNVEGKYYEAQIIKVRGTDQIKIHYIGFPEKWDEWRVTDRNAICNCPKIKTSKKCRNSNHAFATFQTLSNHAFATFKGHVSTEQKYQAMEEEKNELLPFVDGVLERISFNLARASLNIVIVGEVSCGKTTLLNSLFVRPFGNIFKAKTTMSVNIFKVTKSAFSHNYMGKLAKRYSDKSNQYNKRYSKTSEHKIKNIEEFDMSSNDIPDLNKHKLELNVIDIPGFNDGDSNDLLVDWFKRQSYLFDIILFVIDINSSLNTKSEIELLDIVLKRAAINKLKIIFLLNKFDDLEDQEHQMMFDDASKIIAAHSKKFKFTEFQVIRMSAELGYIYRYKKFHKTLEGLSDINTTRLAVLEFGRKAKKWSKEKVKASLMKLEIPEEAIPGYSRFKNALNILLGKEASIYRNKLNNILIHLSDSVPDKAILVFVGKMMEFENIKNVFSPDIVKGLFSKFLILSNILYKCIEHFLTNLDQINPKLVVLLLEYNMKEMHLIFNRLMALKCAKCGTIQAVSYISQKYKCHIYFSNIICNLIKYKFIKKGIRISSMNDFQKIMEISAQFKVFEKLSPGTQIFEYYVSVMCDNGFVKGIDEMQEVIKHLQCTPANIKCMATIMINKLSDVLMDLHSIEKLAGFAPFARDERFIKILQANNADSWFLYLFLSDLITFGLFKPSANYHLFKVVKYVHFGFKSDIKLCLESKYNHGEFKKFPNILATF
jgi:GTPase SAR1 family protein